MKLAISKCTIVHILSDTAPITLHTDASDYVVGRNLFQIVYGKDQPVAFLSKSLNKSQLRWSVIQNRKSLFQPRRDLCVYPITIQYNHLLVDVDQYLSAQSNTALLCVQHLTLLRRLSSYLNEHLPTATHCNPNH